MQHQVCWLFTLPYLLSCLPGEKFRINPADVERVKQISNLTQRDPTAKNVNFAWKMTIRSTVATTMDPARTSTLNDELSKKNNEIYDKLFAQLAYTLRDKTYLNRWLKEMDKGYHIFLYEIQKQDKYYWFKRFEDDDFFEGDEGDKHFQFAQKYLSTLGGREGFDVFVKRCLPKRGNKDDLRIRKPSESEEARNETNSYRLLQVHLAMALTDPEYKGRWFMCIDRGGYDNLLKEMEEKGPRYFLKMNSENEVRGASGGIFWTGFIGYLRYLGQVGFDFLMAKVNTIPKTMNARELLEKKWLELQE